MIARRMLRRWLFVLALFLLALFSFFFCMDCLTPKFRDLTVEYGTRSLTIEDFQTEYAWSPFVDFVTDVTTVDISRTGETQVTLRHNLRKETITLRVVDTTPPEAAVAPSREISVNGFPEASELVSDIRDMSEVTVSYREEPRVPLDYADLPVTLVLEDAAGNRTEKVCVFSFRWMPESVTLEAGQEITQELFLYNPQRDGNSLDPLELARVRNGGIGDYTLTSTISGQTQQCELTVRDTQGPELVVRDVQSYYPTNLYLNAFVQSAEDPSGVAEVRLVSENGYMTFGTHTVIIEAEDNLGNVTRKEAKLYVARDFIPPQITADLTPLVVEKHAQLPDLLQGVTATDDVDKEVTVTCDVSGVNTAVGGTYYAIYRAMDSSGNVRTEKRRIDVPNDEEDTKNLAAKIASGFADTDIEGMREYVCNSITYTSDWGQNDPVWFGFTERRGNCYVHASCLKALLDAKGIPNELIWTTDQSHYWVMVKMDGKWVHLEPTPFSIPVPEVMNDYQRLATLSGRWWDMTQWPASP